MRSNFNQFALKFKRIRGEPKPRFVFRPDTSKESLVQRLYNSSGLKFAQKIYFSRGMANRITSFLTSRPKMLSFLFFTTSYWQLLHYCKDNENEVLRMAGAGSLVTHTCELGFYFVDTINSRSKVQQ